LHGKRYYFWVTDTKKLRTKEFFVDENNPYHIPLWFYQKHEQIFYALIHNYEFTKDHRNADIENLVKVFGNQPNKTNLQRFFRNDVI
jgi:hypothetical protein